MPKSLKGLSQQELTTWSVVSGQHQPCTGVHAVVNVAAHKLNRDIRALFDQVVLAEDLLSSQKRLVAIKVMKRHCTQFGLEVGLQ